MCIRDRTTAGRRDGHGLSGVAARGSLGHRDAWGRHDPTWLRRPGGSAFEDPRKRVRVLHEAPTDRRTLFWCVRETVFDQDDAVKAHEVGIRAIRGGIDCKKVLIRLLAGAARP